MPTTLRSLLAFLLVPLLMVSCKKDDPAPPPATGGGPEGPAQFTPSLSGHQGVGLTMDGTYVSYVHSGGSSGEVIPVYDVQTMQGATSYKSFMSGLFQGSIGENVFELHLGTLGYTEVFLDPKQFINYFQPGPVAYGTVTAPNLSQVMILHNDAQGQVWSTLLGSADQTNSTFTITEVDSGFDDLGAWTRVIATFDCKLYNNSGASKSVTGGGLMLEFRDL